MHTSYWKYFLFNTLKMKNDIWIFPSFFECSKTLDCTSSLLLYRIIFLHIKFRRYFVVNIFFARLIYNIFFFSFSQQWFFLWFAWKIQPPKIQKLHETKINRTPHEHLIFLLENCPFATRSHHIFAHKTFIYTKTWKNDQIPTPFGQWRWQSRWPFTALCPR